MCSAPPWFPGELPEGRLDPLCAGLQPMMVHLLTAPLTRLFDHRVRLKEEHRGDRDPQGLRRLEVDDELKLGGLLHRQVGGLRAFEDLVHEDGRAPLQVQKFCTYTTIRPPPPRTPGSQRRTAGAPAPQGLHSVCADSRGWRVEVISRCPLPRQRRKGAVDLLGDFRASRARSRTATARAAISASRAGRAPWTVGIPEEGYLATLGTTPASWSSLPGRGRRSRSDPRAEQHDAPPRKPLTRPSPRGSGRGKEGAVAVQDTGGSIGRYASFEGRTTD